MSLPDLTQVRKDYTDAGDLFQIACEYLSSPEVAAYNDFQTVVVPSYYDLVYDCSEAPLELAETISKRLLVRSAEHWGIVPSAEPCDGVPTMIDGNAIISVSTLPGNRLVSELACQTLVPGDGECCEVVHNQMTFIPYPEYSEIDLWAFVRDALNDEAIAGEDDSFRVAFIGSVIDTSRVHGTDVLDTKETDNGASFAGINRDPTETGSDEISPIGGLMMGSLVAAALAVGFIMLRRRRQTRREMNISRSDGSTDYPEINVISEGKTAHENSHEVVSDFNKHGLRQVSVSYDDHGQRANDFSSYSRPTTPISNDFEDFESSQMSVQGEGKTAWDLSSSFQREVMEAHGQKMSPPRSPKRRQLSKQYHGPTTIEVVPPYSMEEIYSESEADSWAQTDGTVGSLEDSLEAITVEI